MSNVQISDVVLEGLIIQSLRFFFFFIVSLSVSLRGNETKSAFLRVHVFLYHPIRAHTLFVRAPGIDKFNLARVRARALFLKVLGRTCEGQSYKRELRNASLIPSLLHFDLRYKSAPIFHRLSIEFAFFINRA